MAIHITQMTKLVARWISSGFGSGYALIAPGTWGSAAALIFWYLLHSIGVEHSIQSGVVVFAIIVVVGTLSVGLCIDRGAVDVDAQWIVIDEWAGIFVPLLLVAPSDWFLVGVAFVCFRFFDGLKWGLVAWAEKLPGEFGIMADDIVAGILTAGVVYLIKLAT